MQMSDKRPFIIVYTDILGNKDLTAYEKLVLLGLKKYADNTTGECYPSIKTLADYLGISPRETANCLKGLAEKGAITKTNRKLENGGKTSNLYRLNENIELWRTGKDLETLDDIFENRQLDILLQAKTLDDDYLKELIPLMNERGLLSETVATEQTATESTTEGKEKGLVTIAPAKVTIEPSPKNKNKKINFSANNDTTRPQKSQPPKYNKNDLKEKFLIDWCLQHYTDTAIQSWLSLVFDIICEILNDRKAYQSDKEIILQLSYSDLVFLCEKYDEQTQRQEIRNPRGYITACLRRVKTDSGAYYASKANHDLHNPNN